MLVGEESESPSVGAGEGSGVPTSSVGTGVGSGALVPSVGSAVGSRVLIGAGVERLMGGVVEGLVGEAVGVGVMQLQVDSVKISPLEVPSSQCQDVTAEGCTSVTSLLSSS